MNRTLSSLAVKFPALMAMIVLAISAVFMRSAYTQFEAVLYDASGARLRTSARLVAGLLGEERGRREMATIVNGRAHLRQFLRDGSRRDSAFAALARPLGASLDSTRLRAQLFDPKGRELLDARVGRTDSLVPWAAGAIVAGRVRPSEIAISPILANGEEGQFQVVIPMYESADSARLLGYYVESRRIQGRGVAAVRDLIGVGTMMLFGQPGEGAWSDLERITPAPPPITKLDSAMRFDASVRGPGIGVAHPIRGSPWVVWLQLPHDVVVAPVRAFLGRIAPIAATLVLAGTMLTWLFSRWIAGRIVAVTREIDQVDPTVVGSTPRSIAAVAKLHAPRDEIDRLEFAYQRMSARLQSNQQAEAQLMQSRKLEAIGRLAGGIAHDFNNVLTVMSNYGEMVQAELPADSTASRDMEEVMRAADRAARLTKQLLAFSRQQRVVPRPVNLNEVIQASRRMFERLIPTNIVIETEYAEGLPAVFADPIQMEQVLLNLVINGSDAMPSGGRLSIRTSATELDGTFAPDGSPAPTGQQVCVAITDTGIGMDRDTLAKIYEPFFSTKPIGKGTGLGLPTVHGIVSQSGGRIWVYSELGVGTTFKVYLPATDQLGEPVPEPQLVDPDRARGTGTILLVEDDPMTREVTRRLLERNGYSVVVAEDARDALNQLEQNATPVDIVITDVMMPGMNGVDLAERIARRLPELPVLLMSGYSDAEIRTRTTVTQSRAFVEKPFTSSILLAAVRSALVSAGGASRPAGRR